MRMLRDQGISLIYISHKMDEIFEICDEISVLRDGNPVSYTHLDVYKRQVGWI